MDQHIADLLGLDLTDPETAAAIKRAGEEEEARLEAAGPGRTIAVYIPADVPDAAAEQLVDQIADLVHSSAHEIHLVGHAGDPLHIWTEPQA